jgi:hypothetical protein
MKKTAALLAFASMLAISVSANAATLTLFENPNDGPPSQTGETQLFFTLASGNSTTAGFGSQTGTPTIPFTGTASSGTLTYANGFATITPATNGASITSETVGSINGPGFNDFIFDANFVNNTTTPLTVVALLNGTQVGTNSRTSFSNGTETFYGSLSSGLFNQLQITGNFTSLAHFELSGGPATVPLPPAVLLFGSGLAGLSLLARRRRPSQQRADLTA